MKYFLKISSLMTAITLLFHLPCSAMEGNDEPIRQSRKLALYKDTKDCPKFHEQKPLDKKIGKYMYRFAIKCGEETEKEDFKKNNKKTNDGFTRLAPLDALVNHLLSNQFKYVVDPSADFKEYVLVLENVDTTDLGILMPLVRPLMHSNPFYVQYIPRNSFEAAVKNIFDGIEREVYKERENAQFEQRQLGCIEEPKFDRGPMNVKSDLREYEKVTQANTRKGDVPSSSDEEDY